MKKVIAALLVLVMMFTFAACNQTGVKDVAVTVKISSGLFVTEGAAYVHPNYATAGEAVQNFCHEQKLAFRTDNGLYDGFGGLDSTLTDGWLLYINGELSEVGADTAKIKDGDVIEFCYKNYEMAYEEENVQSATDMEDLGDL